jgi:tetratricopeptide (TPR) repeat protein
MNALDIDPTLAEAHANVGWIAFWYEWSWSNAEKHFRHALELDPNDWDSHLGYAHLLSNIGRHTEALVEVRRARELNPLHLLNNALEGLFLLNAGQADGALESLRKTLALDANFWFTHFYFSSAYLELGRFADAAAEASEARRLSGGNTLSMVAEACALVRLRKRKEAKALLDELLQLSTRRYVPPYHLALLYNELGEHKQALAWLERGLEDRDPKMTFLQVDPKWKDRRDSPGFIDIVRRIGLPSSGAGVAA